MRTGKLLIAATTVMLTGVMGGATAQAAEAHDPHQGSTTASSRTPQIARAWVKAWNSHEPQQLSDLFTQDGTYTDNALGTTSKGRDGVAGWATATNAGIADVHVELKSAFRSGNRVAMELVYAGHVRSAPKSFAVPLATTLTLKNGRIAADQDYYNLASVLSQSGLPADAFATAP